MKMVLVHNPNSGSALSTGALRSKCKKANIEIETLITVRDGFERKLRPYIENKHNIGVIGGDGTISAVAGLVAGTDAVLIPLPGGTLNHFTKDLGIPQNIDEALERLPTSRIRRIDAASVNGLVFINNSSLGLYSASLLERGEFQSRIGKWPAAVVASLRALFRFRLYKIAINNKTFHTPFVFVGNNVYDLNAAGGARRTKLDSGVLTVFIVKTKSRLVLLKIALYTFIGRASGLPEFDIIHTKKFTLSTQKATVYISRDGEIDKVSTPLKYETKKGVLMVR